MIAKLYGTGNHNIEEIIEDMEAIKTEFHFNGFDYAAGKQTSNGSAFYMLNHHETGVSVALRTFLVTRPTPAYHVELFVTGREHFEGIPSKDPKEVALERAQTYLTEHQYNFIEDIKSL